MVEIIEENYVLVYILAGLGSLFVIKWVLAFVFSLYTYFIRCGYNLRKRYGNNSGSNTSWVAITGATGEIGFSYCKHFAELGFNILLIVRNEEKAETAMNKLHSLHPNVETSFIRCDLGTLARDKDEMDRMKQELETFIITNKNDVAILINNAGIEYDVRHWCDVDVESYIALMNVNMVSCVVLTQLLMPYLQQRVQLQQVSGNSNININNNNNNNDKRMPDKVAKLVSNTSSDNEENVDMDININKNINGNGLNSPSACGRRSCVINISSLAGTQMFAGLAVYGASKAFLRHWSICASKEYENDKIDFISFDTGPVASPLTNFKPNKLLGIVKGDTFVKASMKQIGKCRRHCGYWFHGLWVFSCAIFPDEIRLFLSLKVVLPLFKILAGDGKK